MRLIRCILDPLINRRAPINHANPRFATSRGQAVRRRDLARRAGQCQLAWRYYLTW
jgi:hypothetical protein